MYLGETTIGSQGKTYGFEASRIELVDTQTLEIIDSATGEKKTISYNFRNQIKKIKN